MDVMIPIAGGVALLAVGPVAARILTHWYLAAWPPHQPPDKPPPRPQPNEPMPREPGPSGP